MKTAKKAIVLALCAVLLVVGTVAGTMAYLTDSKTVKNTFTVGNVAITLDEAVVDEYGAEIGGRTEGGNNYKLIPGHKYVKDPTVTVKAGSEKAYVRMIVTVTDLADLKTACGVAPEDKLLLQNYVTGWDSAKWISTNVITEQDNKAEYEFRYYSIVNNANSDQKLEALFEAFTMPKTATNTQLEKLDELKIDVAAYAIQADGFDNADDAWNAWSN